MLFCKTRRRVAPLSSGAGVRTCSTFTQAYDVLPHHQGLTLKGCLCSLMKSDLTAGLYLLDCG